MNPQIKERLLKALDTYPKTKGNLRDDKGYCCLGVVCDLYQKEHPEAFWEQESDGVYMFHTSPEDKGGEYTFLPDKVNEWAGFKSRSILIDFRRKNSGRVDSLVDLNDRTSTFTRIKNAIRLYF